MAIVGSAMDDKGMTEEAYNNMRDVTVTMPDGQSLRAVDTPEGTSEDKPEVKPEDKPEEKSEALELIFKGAQEVPELETSLTQVNDHVTGYDEMKAGLLEGGKLSADQITSIESEFQTSGALSAKSYAALKEAGLSGSFVDSYIRGQEALASQYASGIMQMAGGEQGLGQLLQYFDSVGSSEAFEAAVVNRDLATVKSLMSIAHSAMKATLGSAPKRDLTAKATAKQTPATKLAPAAEPFASRDEMVKAMSDRRYGNDPKFTSDVEKRVMASNFSYQ